MNRQKIHWLIDWCAIIFLLIIVLGTTTTDFFWAKYTYIAPIPTFLILCILFLNHISIKECFQTKEKEFFLMCGGIFLSGINIILIKSHLGAFFTITNILLVFYLANKIQFDKIQLGAIAAVSFSIIFYWLFINKEVYENILTNPNRASLFIFIHFCIFIGFIIYLLASFSHTAKWVYHVAILLTVCAIAQRILSLHCRGVFLATIIWVGTYYILPKKKYTICLVFGASFLLPVVYVLMWKSGFLDNIVIYGKKLSSGRDIIWYEFFKVFIRHPITGIGSDFDRMLPDLYMKDTHHALLDLLFVHGFPVFLIVLYLMYKRISEIITASPGAVRSVCIASIYAIIASGSLENFYIVSPINVLFLVVFIIFHTFTLESPKDD